MNSTSLDKRIRAVRQRMRATQPLEYRIQAVRERIAAARGRRKKTVQVRLDQA